MLKDRSALDRAQWPSVRDQPMFGDPNPGGKVGEEASDLGGIRQSLRKLADRDLGDNERIAAARHLEAAFIEGSSTAWEGLSRVLFDIDDSGPVRIAVVDAVSQAPAMAVNKLVFVCGGEPEVRKAALDALRNYGRTPTALEGSLAQALQRIGAEDYGESCVLVANLGMSYGWDQRIVALLPILAAKEDPQLRRCAALAAAHLGETEVLTALTQDRDGTVRAWVAELLGRFSLQTDPERQALLHLTGDPDPQVQKAARTALRRLGFHVSAPRLPMKSRGPASEWVAVLERLSRTLLEDHVYAADAPEHDDGTGWLGRPGATPDAIRRVERRLRLTLPPSLRDLLRTSNGFPALDPPLIGGLLAAEDIGRLVDKEPEWVRGWTEARDGIEPVADSEYFVYGAGQVPELVRDEYLADAVQIGELKDGGVVLLAPSVVTADGDWEAWFFASWLPGARRWPSLREMVQDLVVERETRLAGG